MDNTSKLAFDMKEPDVTLRISGNEQKKTGLASVILGLDLLKTQLANVKMLSDNEEADLKFRIAVHEQKETDMTSRKIVLEQREESVFITEAALKEWNSRLKKRWALYGSGVDELRLMGDGLDDREIALDLQEADFKKRKAELDQREFELIPRENLVSRYIQAESIDLTI
jgi:hypothetical protein